MKVKDLITDLINRLQAEASSEPNQKSLCDEETSKATEKKEDLDADVAKHSSPLETAVPNSTESVNEGHLDKICDQFSDVVFDACLTCDAKCKVASETCVKDNMFMVTGEITVAGKLHHETVVRGVMPYIEFDSSIDDFSSVDSRRLSHQDCEGLFQVGKQSPDIADGVRVDRDDLHAMFAAEGTQQPHRSKQHHDSQQQQATNKQQRQQAGQTEEEEKEEGERRKGERRKEEERDAEEQECKQVKKDATGRTVVTRNKRQRKMVQIFVKVDEAKVTPMCM